MIRYRVSLYNFRGIMGSDINDTMIKNFEMKLTEIYECEYN